MQQEARFAAMSIARAQMNQPPINEPEPLRDFGFYFNVTDVVYWYMNLERFGFLPEPGHISQQDWRKMRDIDTLRQLVNEESQLLRGSIYDGE